MSGVSAKTSIEWATRSWNPTVGCTRVSDGCTNCYAYTLHDRMRYGSNVRAARDAGYRSPVSARTAGVALPHVRQYDLPFSKVQLFEHRLDDPGHWPDPELVFVDSMADVLHPAVPDAFLSQVFDTMERVDRHIYFVLTKRPERAATFTRARYLNRNAPPQVWLGTSIEDERVLDRADSLRESPAHVRFLSCEPLLGPLSHLNLAGIHWVIAGGESGFRHRAVDPGWVRELRDMCVEQDVAFFFKQWGGRTPKAGGRRLDGRLWSQYPSVPVSPSASARRQRAARLAA